MVSKNDFQVSGLADRTGGSAISSEKKPKKEVGLKEDKLTFKDSIEFSFENIQVKMPMKWLEIHI